MYIISYLFPRTELCPKFVLQIGFFRILSFYCGKKYMSAVRRNTTKFSPQAFFVWGGLGSHLVLTQAVGLSNKSMRSVEAKRVFLFVPLKWINCFNLFDDLTIRFSHEGNFSPGQMLLIVCLRQLLIDKKSLFCWGKMSIFCCFARQLRVLRENYSQSDQTGKYFS